MAMCDAESVRIQNSYLCLWGLAVLDLLILIVGVALLRHRDECSIDNLSALGVIATSA